jgi:hypothetical protein
MPNKRWKKERGFGFGVGAGVGAAVVAVERTAGFTAPGLGAGFAIDRSSGLGAADLTTSGVFSRAGASTSGVFTGTVGGGTSWAVARMAHTPRAEVRIKSGFGIGRVDVNREACRLKKILSSASTSPGNLGQWHTPRAEARPFSTAGPFLS